MNSFRRARGATLIELVIAIVIIASASVTVIGLTGTMAKRSAETMVSVQAINIANAYLQEILDKPIIDPDGSDAGETRDTFDNIDDYLRLPDTDVRDRFEQQVPGLEAYEVAIVIQRPGLNGIPTAQTRSVEVTVTDPLDNDTVLVGIRTWHE